MAGSLALLERPDELEDDTVILNKLLTEQPDECALPRRAQNPRRGPLNNQAGPCAVSAAVRAPCKYSQRELL